MHHFQRLSILWPNMKEKDFNLKLFLQSANFRMQIFYREDLEKRGACGVVAHEKHESHVSQ